MEEEQTQPQEDFLETIRKQKAELEAQLKQSKEHLQELRNEKARDIMGGTTTIEKPEKPKEDTPEEYVKKLEKGEIGFSK